MVKRRERRKVVTLVLFIGLMLLIPCNACFRSLRRPSYETYWLGTYHDSRILSLTCFALRSFRWSLKFLKSTYESWHVEMEYANCISETYGMNIPFISPPWIKHARMLEKYSTESSDSENSASSHITWAEQLLNESPGQTKSYLTHSKESRMNYQFQKWAHDNDVHEIMTSLQPLFTANDKASSAGSIIPKDDGSTQELMRIIKSFYQIFQSFFHEFEMIFSRTFGAGVLSCTRKFIKNAFWRWVDSAPFLK